MRVLILAPGSRGDVAPAARIAFGLIADGHEVTIVAHTDYRDAVTGVGSALIPFTAALSPPSDPGQKAPGVRGYLAHLRTYMLDHAQAALTAAADGGFGAVITNPISAYGHDIAEALGLPSAEALLQPAEPSRAYPPMAASNLDLGPAFNRGLGRLVRRLPAPYVPAIAHVRTELGLPGGSRHAARKSRMRAGVPVHHGISPFVLPRPKDWPSNLSLDGFWWPVVDEDWTPAPELEAFLDAGETPVLITLGSVEAGSGAETAVADFVRATRRRVIVQGSNGPALAETIGRRVFAAGDVPHSWLLPKVAAVVHQAGAGITAACLRAGVPGVPIPQHTDQFFWAKRAHGLGAAVRPLRGRGISGEGIAAGVERATGDEGLRGLRAEIAARLVDGDSTLALRRWVAESDV